MQGCPNLFALHAAFSLQNVLCCLSLTSAHAVCLLSDLPIFSIDIHPDGSRFATGGQGEVIIFLLQNV